MKATNLLGPAKIDESRTIWVIMANDKTHVLPNPDGSGTAWWTYNEIEADVVMMSLKKDFKNKKYSKVTLAVALGLIGEKQSELQAIWRPALTEIAKRKTLEDKWEVYSRAKKKLGAHPIIMDVALRTELQID